MNIYAGECKGDNPEEKKDFVRKQQINVKECFKFKTLIPDRMKGISALGSRTEREGVASFASGSMTVGRGVDALTCVLPPVGTAMRSFAAAG